MPLQLVLASALFDFPSEQIEEQQTYRDGKSELNSTDTNLAPKKLAPKTRKLRHFSYLRQNIVSDKIFQFQQNNVNYDIFQFC